MNVLDEQQWVKAARSGDGAAFARLIKRHYPALLTGCERMLNDRDAARDAAQEATLRAMLGLGRLRDDTRFGAWLVGIGLNVCRGLLVGRWRQVSLDALLESGHLAEPSAEGTEPADLIAAEELAVRVRGAIAALPAGQREAVALFYIEGLTQAEAAAEIGARPGAVKTRLHKARRTLRASLHDTYEEYLDMTDGPSTQMIAMHVAELRRTPTGERHIVFLQDDLGRRLPIWIGQPEATAMALILEKVQLPRPGVYQFTASLLAGAGARLREVRVTELTESTFYAQAILSDDTSIDARPSDAITLALITDTPIYVAAGVLTRADETREAYRGLITEADAAVDDAQVIADEAKARYAETLTAHTTDPQD